MRAILVVFAALLAGCGLELPDGQIRCAATEPSCPRGMFCAFDGTCWRSSHGPRRDYALGQPCSFDDSCASGSCADGVCCASACRGACTTCASPDKLGTCVPVVDGQVAGPEHEACSPGELCRADRCARKDRAEPCASDLECESGACVDGVCCERRCDRCAVCDAPGSVGTCTLAAAGTDPHKDCFSATADAVCQASCDGLGACLIPTAACKTDCVETQAVDTPVSQSSAAVRREFACSAAGRCEFVAAKTSCISSICDPTGTICTTSCANDLDCLKGNRCVSGNCVLSYLVGHACTRDLECSSGFCDPGTMTCKRCTKNAECSYQTYCGASSDCNTPSQCSVRDCVAEGFGDACRLDTGVAVCTASDASKCTNPRAPVFSAGLCVCSMSVGGSGCGIGEVCSSTSDPSTAHCLGVAGRGCYADLVCASGKCTNQVCEKAGVGVLCLGPADCVSGVCAPTMASNGRPVCN